MHVTFEESLTRSVRMGRMSGSLKGMITSELTPASNPTETLQITVQNITENYTTEGQGNGVFNSDLCPHYWDH